VNRGGDSALIFDVDSLVSGLVEAVSFFFVEEQKSGQGWWCFCCCFTIPGRWGYQDLNEMRMMLTVMMMDDNERRNGEQEQTVGDGRLLCYAMPLDPQNRTCLYGRAKSRERV